MKHRNKTGALRGFRRQSSFPHSENFWNIISCSLENAAYYVIVVTDGFFRTIHLEDLTLSAASSREDYSPKRVCQDRKDTAGGVSCDVVRIDVLYSLQHGHAFGEKVWWKNLGKRGGDRVEIGIVQLGTAAGSLVVPREERTLLV